MTEGFRRNNFFSGRVLTASDLEVEQSYFRAKQKLHNRALHGFGIVSGLEVSYRRDKLVITSGLALDCEGNEIALAESQSYPLPQLNTDTSVFLIIRYSETSTNSTPIADPEKSLESALIEEGFSLTFAGSNPNQGHRRQRGRWQSCGKPHGLVIARLRKSSGQWRLDPRLRRATVK